MLFENDLCAFLIRVPLLVKARQIHILCVGVCEKMAVWHDRTEVEVVLLQQVGMVRANHVFRVAVVRCIP